MRGVMRALNKFCSPRAISIIVRFLKIVNMETVRNCRLNTRISFKTKVIYKADQWLEDPTSFSTLQSYMFKVEKPIILKRDTENVNKIERFDQLRWILKKKTKSKGSNVFGII